MLWVLIIKYVVVVNAMGSRAGAGGALSILLCFLLEVHEACIHECEHSIAITSYTSKQGSGRGSGNRDVHISGCTRPLLSVHRAACVAQQACMCACMCVSTYQAILSSLSLSMHMCVCVYAARPSHTTGQDDS